jgi:hypothetical protein
VSYGATEDRFLPERSATAVDASSSKSGLVLLFAPALEKFRPAYVFDGPELIIGRDAHNEVCVPEPAVSRQHACIAYRHPHWVLCDYGSRNGTLVNGVFVVEVALENLHEIRIGDAVFKFVRESADGYVRYGVDGRVTGERLAKTVTAFVGGWQIDRVAAAIERIAPTDRTCVISGETGTGKDLAASELHRASGRRGLFQSINCAAVPPLDFEGALFGDRRGAFAGADGDRHGLIERCNGGTLLLDEVGAMPLEAQGRLLSVLREREVRPLGASQAERVDTRFLCATRHSLEPSVREGKFREDLFVRLNEHALVLPPLRERKEDVFQLARAFATKHGRPELDFTVSFMVALLHYDWPFNVRELESCIERGAALAGEGQPLDTRHLPGAIFEHMTSYGERGHAPGGGISRPPRSARAEPDPIQEVARQEVARVEHPVIACVPGTTTRA